VLDVEDVWLREFDRFALRVAGRFFRPEPRDHASSYLRALCAGLERRNGWTISEHAGRTSPDAMQRLLRLAVFDVDGIRDDVRALVVERLADRDAVLVFDETGFVKKGRRSAGVQPQYSGTSGGTANCQIGVFAAYVSGRGHALIDRELYLPRSWTDDRDRSRAAGIPDDVEFASKPRMMMAMLQRTIEAKVPFTWVLADEVYGRAKYLRVWMEERQISYVLAVSCDDIEVGRDGLGAVYADDLASLPARKWKRLSAGPGAHGHRLYDWARVDIRTNPSPGQGHWLLARRSISDPTDIAYYACHGPAHTTLTALATVAGRRWPIEECFQQAKNEAGLDQYQVRSWRAWYAHITLSMAALALLVITRTASLANPLNQIKRAD
jgi:SRSO17 transposase